MKTNPPCAAVLAAMLALSASACFSQAPGKDAPPPGDPEVLQPLYRVQTDTDGFLTTTKAEDPKKVVGQPAYLSAKPLPGTLPLYRYKDPVQNIYRDARSLNAPWKQEEYLGSTWVDGTNKVLLRQYADANGHYVTRNANEKIPDGYKYVCDLGYGYERFDMDVTRLMSLKRGDVEVCIDRVSGGCVWHILHKDVQLVNNYFYGRQVCTALDIWTNHDDAKNPETGRYCPCDCGLTANLKSWFTSPLVRMGAPCPVFAKQGDTATIRTIPVESNAATNKHLGGGALNPVAYSGISIDKQITIGVLGRDGIIKFKASFTDKNSWRGIVKSRVNICGIHLCKFMNRLSLFDPSSGKETEEENWLTSPTNQMFRKSYTDKPPLPKGSLKSFTCVILHDGKDHAVGIMGAGPEKGGSVGYFLGYHWKELDDGKDGAEFGNSTIMMTPMSESPIRKGFYTLYLLVGTPAEVTGYAREMYAKRSTLEW